ncbi:DUF7146 domain-containing protein [Xanthobacter versatilis]|uniref:DUF7146 domain-containing protein n=1 Tax=Xanthobacter autotrophicus (strain ATCC BAA-1158 / Py2) TaxID=78245 RepID=UPI003728D13B
MSERLMHRGGLDARQMVESLGGRWTGRGGLCFCPAHRNSRTPALSVSIGKDGGAVFHCHAGCSYADIVTAMRESGIAHGDGAELHQRDPGAIAKAIREAEARRIKNARRAVAKWQAARPCEGSVVETYFAKRGLRAPIPQSLRYLPNEWHPSGRFDAMVACVQGVSSPALHLTFIDANGTKAPGQPARLFIGSAHGGGVCLASRPGPLVVGEGIESTLSAATKLPDHGPVWAALSASGMAAFQLPPKPDDLVIAIDADHAGRNAGRALGERASSRGWRVFWAEPPDGLDWNDVLQGQREGGR